MVDSSGRVMSMGARWRDARFGIPFGLGIFCGAVISLLACVAWYGWRIHWLNTRLEPWAKSEIALSLFRYKGADVYVLHQDMTERFWNRLGFGPVDLSGLKITDADLARIAGASDITALNLSRTQVTDGCLSTLATLPDLKYLNVRETKVTAKGLQQFSKDAPRCLVNEGEW